MFLMQNSKLTVELFFTFPVWVWYNATGIRRHEGDLLSKRSKLRQN